MKLPPPGLKQPIPDWGNADDRVPVREYEAELGRGKFFMFNDRHMRSVLRLIRAAERIPHPEDTSVSDPVLRWQELNSVLIGFDLDR